MQGRSVLRVAHHLINRDVRGSEPQHDIGHRLKRHVNRVAEGLGRNLAGAVVADIVGNDLPRCTIDIDRRVIPGEDRDAVIPEIISTLEKACDFPIEHGSPYVNSPPLGDDANHPLADKLLASIRPIAGPKTKLGVPYGTHASRVALAGVPAVVFGPGDIAQAHTKDEWVELDQVKKAVECYYRFCLEAAKC